MAEWRKLIRVNKQPTRLVGLPASVIRQLGLDPAKELRARWVVDGKTLKLEIEVVKNE